MSVNQASQQEIVFSVKNRQPRETYQKARNDFAGRTYAVSKATRGCATRVLDAVLTISIIFSLSLTPVVILETLTPKFVIFLMSSPVGLLFIPYIICMIILGLKISDLFGCTAWRRIKRASKK